MADHVGRGFGRVRHVMPHMCGKLCGSKSLILLGCAACAACKQLSRACVREPLLHVHVCARVCREVVYMPHMPHMPHTPIHIKHLRDVHAAHVAAHASRMPHTVSFSFFLKKVGGWMGQRTIRCTAENAKEFQELVKADPELLALVQGLQAQNLFPGLRGLSVTVTGDEKTLAKGLGAWPAQNAPQAAQGGV